MKLTKKQINALLNVVRDLERAKTFVMSDKIAIVGKYNYGATTLHFGMPDGQYGIELCKEIGSDLTGLFNGLGSLKKFIETETSPKG